MAGGGSETSCPFNRRPRVTSKSLGLVTEARESFEPKSREHDFSPLLPSARGQSHLGLSQRQLASNQPKVQARRSRTCLTIPVGQFDVTYSWQRDVDTSGRRSTAGFALLQPQSRRSPGPCPSRVFSVSLRMGQTWAMASFFSAP